ncbi:MAG: CDP-alcohol phosphatidyltransferase [Verrucomicrobia bacterium]|nr:MAG: CDP-alcohol phosphatidyltransferase [Verrucomicrobiota bacterium]PYL82858.1 MAG: CDP-alcohol phosphatidyltransferase [Verrucomicrobiota bacterium]
MPEQIESAPTLEATYKAPEVEGVLDLYFYRPIGFRLAQFFERLKMTPAGVTLFAGLFGIVAGHLYFYRNLRVNIVGMALHVCANALDNADGQLARLTHRETREGRIIDSLADHIGFLSIYVHLTLRYLAEGSSPAICLLAMAAGISHALQGAAADYYRSTYLYFVTNRARMGLDSAAVLRSDYQELSWRSKPWNKFLLALYLNFTRQQEMLAPQLKKLRDLIGQLFQGEIPNWLRTRYRNLASPTLKWWGLLMTNSRMLVLFALLFIGQPIYYFWFELIPLNLLLVYLITRQEHMAESLLEVTEQWGNSA